MQWRNTATRYGVIAQLFHWVIVGLIISQYTLASIFEDMPLGLEKIAWIVRHKELGMLVLVLAVMRLLWRVFNTPPALPAGMPGLARSIAQLTHWLLYALIILIPVSGWLMSSFAKIPVDFFGWFHFPDLVDPNKAMVKTSKTVHEALGTALLVVVILHLLAALKHHFKDKDDVLLRMLPSFGRQRSE